MLFFNIIFIVIGFSLLVKGADFLVDGAANIAKKFRISELIIGMTIVAMGTSMPELIVSVKSALSAHADLSVGNIIGSNLVNMLLILGLCAIIKPLQIQKRVKLLDAPINLIITIILLIFCNYGVYNATIDRVEGIVFIVLFICYLIYTIFQGKKENNDEIEDIKNNVSILQSVFYIIIGICGLKFGADFVVDNAIIVAQAFGVSEKLIGLTIVAIGTSLPELISSIVAVKKNSNDLAIGNILGSNIFNILLILGITAIINPIKYNILYNFDMALLIITSILLVVFPRISEKNKMTRREGMLYVLMYIIYMAVLMYLK